MKNNPGVAVDWKQWSGRTLHLSNVSQPRGLAPLAESRHLMNTDEHDVLAGEMDDGQMDWAMQRNPFEETAW